MTKKKAIAQLENLKEHCNEMSNNKYGKVWEKDVTALNIAIDLLKNDRNEIIVNDIKKIIKKYDDMNLTISHEERRDNNVKAYMEIKNKINDCEKE